MFCGSDNSIWKDLLGKGSMEAKIHVKNLLYVKYDFVS